MVSFHWDTQLNMGNCFVLTVHLLQSFTYGSFLSILGPSLPDLQCLLEEDDESIKSLLFLVTVGCISWTLVLPVCVKRCAGYYLVAFCSGLMFLGFIILPFVGSLYLAAGLVFMMAGSIELGVSVQKLIALATWPSEESILHIILLVVSFGSVLGPLILSPFLSDGFITLYFKEMTTGQQVIKDKALNNSIDVPKDGQNLGCGDNFTTLMAYPYILCSAVPLLCMLGSLYLQFKGGTKTISEDYETVDTGVLDKYLETLYRLLTFLWFSSVIGLTDTFSILLPTFGVSSVLAANRSNMSLMVSLYFILLILGRIFGIRASPYMHQKTIVIISVIGSNVCVIFLSTTLLLGEDMLWTVSAALGFFTGPLSGSGFLFCTQSIPPNASLTSWYMIALSCALVHPYICGFLMAHFGPTVFLYYLSALCFMVNLMLISLCIFYRRVSSLKKLDQCNNCRPVTVR